MPILSCENVSFSYDKKTTIIKDFSLQIEKGEFVSIIGHNGSGKSTLAKLFNGLILPTAGKVIVDGFCSSEKSTIYEIRKRVGVVFQNPDNGIVASIIEDDVAFGPENLGLDREEIKKRIDYALSAVNMTEYKKGSPDRLSGGQKQRVAIAGVLALLPKIIVLDESTSMLDPKGRKEVISTVKELNRQGVTVINTTHYMDEVIDSDRVIVVCEGKKVLDGTPKEVFKERDILNNCGLEVPPATLIADELTKRGVKLPNNILTEKELVEELCKLKRKI